MFDGAYAFYLIDIILGASVQDGELRSVYLYQAVVNTQCIEGGHTMFHGTYFYSVLGEYGAAGGLGHIVCNGINGGLSFQIEALDLVSMIVRGRIESNGQVKSRMKTFSAKRKAVF